MKARGNVWLLSSGLGLLVLVAGFYVYRNTMCTCSHDTKDDGKKVSSKTSTTEQKALSVQILQEAALDAARPKTGDRVSVHYTGWLNDHDQLGEQFDSSYSRNAPFEFVLGVGSVISGWDIAVGQMKVGEKRRVFIPSELAYGAYGAGGIIPPHADLIFDIELIEIV